jgi:hypothetical protein
VLGCGSGSVGTLERVTKQLSEETNAEARGMLLLCARDGTRMLLGMLLLCARDGVATARVLGGTQRSSRLTWTLPKFTRGVTEAATMEPGTARAVAPGTAPGGFGAVVGGLLSVVPIRRATSKRWTTHNGTSCP